MKPKGRQFFKKLQFLQNCKKFAALWFAKIAKNRDFCERKISKNRNFSLSYGLKKFFSEFFFRFRETLCMRGVLGAKKGKSLDSRALAREKRALSSAKIFRAKKNFARQRETNIFMCTKVRTKKGLTRVIF